MSRDTTLVSAQWVEDHLDDDGIVLVEVDEDTSDFRYVRLHGDVELYASGYSDRALDQWADSCRRWAENRDVFVYFDNDIKVHAPFDAIALQERLGLTPS